MTTTAYVNGVIYTSNPAQPWAEAFVVDDRRIASIGQRREIAAQIAGSATTVDLQGRMVMPGIHDGHTHLVDGVSKVEVAFPPGADEATIVAALSAWQGPLRTDRDGNEWLVGGRYWPNAITPTKEFLDAAFPDRPVMLHDRSGHNELVNSLGLRLAGIDRETAPATPHGEIVKDADGEPTGELCEHASWPLNRAVRHSDAVLREAVASTIDLNHQYGVTSIQDASTTAGLLHALRSLDDAGELTLHVAGHLVWHEEGFGAATLTELDEIIDHYAEYATAHVDTRFVKLWIDGSPIPPYWTHACIHDDGSVEMEKILIPEEEVREAMVRFSRLGLSVKIHCGGEGGVRLSLDAIEHARQVTGSNEPRHELAHCALVAEEDFPRFAALNVGVEMSPAVWHIPEHNVSHLYYFDRVLAEGAEMTFGTDWSVSDTPNLFPALQGAVERTEHGISLEQGLTALTVSGARAVGREHEWGSLEVGKAADFIVLDRNLFEVPVDQIGATKVLRTVFEGRTVFEDRTSETTQEDWR